MSALPFGFLTTHPATCCKCGRSTWRRITREQGICQACEGALRVDPGEAGGA